MTKHSADVADRVVVMYAGRRVEAGEVHALFTHTRQPYTRALLAATPTPAVAGQARRRLNDIPGTVPTLSEPSRRCSFAERCTFADYDCWTTRPAEIGGGGHVVACLHPRCGT